MRTMRGLYAALITLGLATLAGCGSGRTPIGALDGPEFVEGGVIFRYYDTKATRVYVVGDFNNWSVRSDPMTDKNADGHWTLLYTLSPGLYEYKFVVDGKWIPDPRNPNSTPDGFDGVNSLIRIPKTAPQ